MALEQPQRFDVAELIGGSFRELIAIPRELAFYFLGLGALAGLAGLSFPFAWVFTLLSIVAYFIGQYLLYQVMLRRSGLLLDDGKRIFGLAVMALLLIFPIAIGINLFVIPGIILVAKWIMAPSQLVARPLNLFEALGASWRASEGHTLNLSLAFSVLFVIWSIAFTALGSALETWGSDPSPFWFLLNTLPLLLMGLSVTAYRLLSQDRATLGDVFA